MLNSKNERTSSRILFAVLFILMLLKLSLLRYFFFQGLSGIGLVTDALGALTVVCILDLIVPKRWKRIVYGGFNLLFSLVLFAATLYNVHFSSVPTYTALSEIGQVAQVRGSIGPLIRPSHFCSLLTSCLHCRFGSCCVVGGRVSETEVTGTAGCISEKCAEDTGASWG